MRLANCRKSSPSLDFWRHQARAGAHEPTETLPGPRLAASSVGARRHARTAAPYGSGPPLTALLTRLPPAARPCGRSSPRRPSPQMEIGLQGRPPDRHLGAQQFPDTFLDTAFGVEAPVPAAGAAGGAPRPALRDSRIKLRIRMRDTVSPRRSFPTSEPAGPARPPTGGRARAGEPTRSPCRGSTVDPARNTESLG